MIKLFFFTFIAVSFISCKKDNSNTNNATSYFTFKIGLNTYQIDTLKFGKVVSTSGGLGGPWRLVGR